MSQVPQVPKCQSAWMPECWSVQVPFGCMSLSSAWIFKCQVIWVLEYPCLKCSSARVSWVPKCPWSVLGMPLENSLSAQVSLERSLNKNCLQHHWKWFMMEYRALLLVKLRYYSYSEQFYYWSCRITESSLIF